MTVNTWTIGAVGSACLLALGCAGGGSGSGHTCETPDGRLSSGEYIVANDTTANSQLPEEERVTDYSMCARRAPGSGGSVNTYWEWSWPEASTLRPRATPSIVFGFLPWDEASTTPDLPALVSDVGSLSVATWVSQEFSSNSVADFGVIVYLTTSDQKTGTDPLPIAKRLLVARNRYRPPTVTPTATLISIAGVFWDVVVSEDEVLYYPHEDANEAVSSLGFDLEDFLADALGRDAIEPTWWVASVSTGAIISQGGGTLALTSYRVDFTAK